MYSFVSLTWPATAVAMGKRKADDSKEKEEPEKGIESERRKTRAKQPAPEISDTQETQGETTYTQKECQRERKDTQE